MTTVQIATVLLVGFGAMLVFLPTTLIEGLNGSDIV